MASDPPMEPLWTVTSQQETVDAAGNGTFVQGTRVSFRTRSGALGSVFVPTTEYTVARVKGLLDARATDMETVHNLTGEG